MGNDYDNDLINYEKDISMILDLNKACYFKGEEIKGSIILSSKNGLNETQLVNPYIIISIKEKGQYSYIEGSYEFNVDTSNFKKITKENKNLLTIKIDFPYFEGANLLIGVNIPFKVKIPNNIYPSCFFNSNTYIKHYLVCDFPAIEAKKTSIIVIKNSIYYSEENHLLKAPVIYNKEIAKYKYSFFNSGSFICNATLTKNIFSYNENIPLIIDIDCKNLSVIKNIVIKIYRNLKKNYKGNHLESRAEELSVIFTKTVPLKSGESKYHLETNFKFPKSPNEVNPSQIYLLLDNNKKNNIKTIGNFRLYPSCYGGFLSCEYYIKIKLEIDTLFSNDPTFSIPVDFYEPFNINEDGKNNPIIKSNIHINKINTDNPEMPNNIYNSQQIYQNQFILENNCLNVNKKEEKKVYYNINSIDDNINNKDKNNIEEDEINLPSKEDIISYNNNKNNNIHTKEKKINDNIKSNSPSEFSLFSDNN